MDLEKFFDRVNHDKLMTLVNELDKELERRGHRFVRYADDCNIYVKSQRSGQRVLASITGYLHRRLKLTVNEDKSAVGRPWGVHVHPKRWGEATQGE